MTAKPNGDQYKASQLRKNQIIVYADGDVFAKDEALREIAEGQLYYSPALDRWLCRQIPGTSIRYK